MMINIKQKYFKNVIKTLRSEEFVLQWRIDERGDRVGDIEWVFSKVEKEVNRILGNEHGHKQIRGMFRKL